MKQQKTVLITGVSSGIGKGITQAFVQKGYQVFGSVRKKADGDDLLKELGNSFHPVIFDVTNRAEVEAARTLIEQELNGGILNCLINNAGIAMAGPLMHQSIDVIRDHFDINVLGLLNVTQAFLPLLGARENVQSKPGKIINISSVGGKIAGPFIGAYHGSKFALEGISHTLRRELLLYGIDVIVIGPGSVNTPIWDKGTGTSGYEKTNYHKSLVALMKYYMEEGKKGYSIEEIGQMVLEIFEKDKPNTRYALVRGMFKNWILPRLLPDRMLDKLMGKAAGLSRK
jgi:NAD(P)-dependent dehydrogenase (short-subunit alcohol dehydrogenase family)